MRGRRLARIRGRSRIQRIERRLLAGVWLALAGLALLAWRHLSPTEPRLAPAPGGPAVFVDAAADGEPAPMLSARPELGLAPARIAPSSHRTRRRSGPHPSPREKPPTQAASARPRAGTPESPAVALVLDDFGHDPALVRRTLALDAPVALAFLPYPPRLVEALAPARAAGAEILLHLPMEPRDPRVDPGPVVLRTGMDDRAIAGTIERALSAVPGAVGVNNHMGSRFTADAAGMEAVMRELARRGLWFVDSRTTPRSVAAEAAGRFGVPVAVRDVFIDNERDVAAVLARLEETERIARRLGAALAIGHPHPVTLEALARWIPAARRRGVAFWTVARYIAWRCARPAFSRSAACARHIAARPRRPG